MSIYIKNFKEAAFLLLLIFGSIFSPLLGETFDSQKVENLDIEKINNEKVFEKWPSDCFQDPSKGILEMKVALAFQIANPITKISERTDADGQKIRVIDNVQRRHFSFRFDHGQDSDPRFYPQDREERRLFMIQKIHSVLDDYDDLAELRAQLEAAGDDDDYDYDDDEDPEELKEALRRLELQNQEEVDKILYLPAMENVLSKNLLETVQEVQNSLNEKTDNYSYEYKIKSFELSLLFKDFNNNKTYRECICWESPEALALSDELSLPCKKFFRQEV